MESSAPSPRSFTRRSGARAETLEPRLLMAYTRLAVIGDYSAGQPLADVSAMMASWNPNAIATVGDNNYEDGAAETIDANIGQYFHSYISPYTGSYGAGSIAGNRFWPSIGNHDYYTNNAQPYLDYFTLPGNERYYTQRVGNVELFMVDSNPESPDGYLRNSVEAQWLRGALSASNATWKLVLFHHSPYSSGEEHGSAPEMQWPFQEWGATAVLTGHDHGYERVIRNDFPYMVNGLGGKSLYPFDPPVPGSVIRYNADYGAMRIDAFDQAITFKFIARTGVVIDTYTINAPTASVGDLVRAADVWKFNDSGSDQGTSWRSPFFTDAAWFSGRAKLGYGRGDESTVVASGNITTYFRKTFSVANLASIASLNLHLLSDDGAIVYVNGVEAFRSNMPALSDYSTLASSEIGGTNQNLFITASISPSLLTNGNNVIAVEVHEAALANPDLGFDLELSATLTGKVAPPAAPSGLRALAILPTRIDLAWVDTSVNETGFRIERSTDGVTFTEIATTLAGSQGYSSTSLQSGTKYWFRVRAFNEGGNSVYSAVADATTPVLAAGLRKARAPVPHGARRPMLFYRTYTS